MCRARIVRRQPSETQQQSARHTLPAQRYLSARTGPARLPDSIGAQPSALLHLKPLQSTGSNTTSQAN